MKCWLLVFILPIEVFSQNRPINDKDKGHALTSNPDYVSFYRNYLDQGTIKTREDSVIVSRYYENYIQLFALAKSHALQAVPDPSVNKCNLDHYLRAINLLEDCISYDTSLTFKKVKNDNSFKGIENEYEFRVLFHDLDFEKPRDVRSFIVNKTYRTPVPGVVYHPITTLYIDDNNTWTEEYHENTKEMQEYWHFHKGKEPVLKIAVKKGFWSLENHTLIMQDEHRREIKQIQLTEPGVIDGLYYPDPNDESGSSEVRHFWKCGKCGCK